MSNDLRTRVHSRDCQTTRANCSDPHCECPRYGDSYRAIDDEPPQPHISAWQVVAGVLGAAALCALLYFVIAAGEEKCFPSRGFAMQVLADDPTCPSGMRWKNF